MESVTRTDLAGTEVTYAMSYDANGNLQSDALPRLGSGGTTISNIQSNYQNLPSRIELDLAGSDNTGVIEYRYDTEGRQISRWSWEEDPAGAKVAGTEGNEWSYYDALGRLDARLGLAGGVLDHRLVNLLQVGRRPEGEVGQWVRREFMASDADPDDPLLPGHLTRHWSTYGPRGLLAQTHAPITGAATHEKDVVEAEVVLNDHLGSPRLRLGSSRQVEMGGEVPDLELLGITTSWTPKNPMDYTPFGRELALSSDTKTTPDGYTGKPLDITFGLQAMNYGARFYDPRLGRWWQRDPLAEKNGDYSCYVYGANNPVLLIDPDGRDVAFYNEPTSADNHGHITLFYQSPVGQWFSYDMGMLPGNIDNADERVRHGSDVPGGVDINPVTGPPEGSYRISTTPEQDKAVSMSALKSQESLQSGETEYNVLLNNCKDAAIDVVNGANIGIRIPNQHIEPNSWFEDLMNIDQKSLETSAVQITPMRPLE